MKNCIKLMCFITLGICFCSCVDDFLNVKQDASIVTPNTIEDYNAILNNFSYLNGQTSHELGVIGSDEYILDDNAWRALPTPYMRNGYIWSSNVYEGLVSVDWNNGFERIKVANLVIENLEKMDNQDKNESEWNRIYGAAHFLRAIKYYELAQLFCETFKPEIASNQLGLPLRTESNVTSQYSRSSLLETYQFIIDDLLIAESHLPVNAITNLRPIKSSVYGLLAKTYLLMEEYEVAEAYANEVLKYHTELIDYNGIDLESISVNSLPFPEMGDGNKEILYFSSTTSLRNVHFSTFKADTNFLNLLEIGDLRRAIYFIDFNDNIIFGGSYTGGVNLFSGIALGEVYLIRAECRIRLERIQDGVDDLNFLRKHRFDHRHYIPLQTGSYLEAMEWLIRERRLELYLRGSRWEDLKRFNKEKQFAQTLERIVEGKKYTLPPNDPKWVWPLPDKAIELGGYEQN